MRIAFVGNCQLSAMREIYRRTLAPDRKGDAIYIRSYRDITESARAELARADRVVWQVTEFDQKVTAIETDAPRFFIPMVICPFLWPYAGEPHPHNPTPWFAPEGPYPGEMGNALLNELIRSGAAPTEGVKWWLGTDVASVKKVRRIFEIAMDRQRRRDQL